MFFIYISLTIGAFILSFSLFEPSIKLATALGAIDVPSQRKVHSSPTARLGGITFFAAFFLSLAISPVDIELKIPLILGGSTIFLVGLLDDSLSISPFAKLCGQFIAVSVFVFSGGLGNVPGPILGIAALVWIVFIINATNLSDGLDGLAGGMTASQAFCLAAVALISNNLNVFCCSLLLIASILGFLPRNVPRAKMFMGDCGSLYLGFILSALALNLALSSKSALGVVGIFFIFRVPSADTVQSIFRRLLKRKNPFSADRGHFHHKLIDLGFTRECAALALITISLFFGFIGVVITSL